MFLTIRFFELFKFLNRSVRFILLIMFVLILFYYVKTKHQPSASASSSSASSSASSSLFADQSWMHSVEKFDDNYETFKDQLQYAVVIDAGSSGSRIYIYVWPPHSGDMRQLLKIRMLRDKLGKDVFQTITPGLSSCASKPSNASNYLSPLIQFAVEHIPRSKHKETPLYVLATAGMRLLDQSTQKAILDNLREEIPKRFAFLFTANNIEVISGKDEGIYSWIALNYLTGRFDHSFEKNPLVQVENGRKTITRMNTVSMIEMGGASVQVAFEITNNAQYDQMKSKISANTLADKIAEVNLGCSEHDTNHQYRLYVDTFLTLGANAARSNYVHRLIDQNTFNRNIQYHNSSLTTRETILFDPCLSIDSSETINITNADNNSSPTQYLYHLKGSGQFDQCKKDLETILTKDGLQWCINATCPFDELRKVTIPFRHSEFYGLSEFWYSMQDIFHMGGHYVWDKFVQVSSKYCSTSWLVTQDRYKRKLYPKADFKRLLYQCFKSAWITTILHDGFRMPKQYSKFQSVYSINDELVQWTLGALIFRTRFFPLRTIDDQRGQMMVKHHVHTNIYIQYLLFTFCMLAVIFCICVYLRRLHLMLNVGPNNGGSMMNGKNHHHHHHQASYLNYPKHDDIESYPLYPKEQQQQSEMFVQF